MLPVRIDHARSPGDFDAFGALIRDYVAWFRVRHERDAAFAERVFGYQALDVELSALAVTYGPPAGQTVLAHQGSDVCGGGAYRRLTGDSCEMKRLFVPERCQGQGIGRLVACALIERARADGYRIMRLDTAVLLTEAIALYRTIGFTECPAYRDYPPDLRGHLMFMELSLH